METHTGVSWFSSREQQDPHSHTHSQQIISHFKSHPHVPQKVPAAVRCAWSTVMNNRWVLKPEKPATANAWSKAKTPLSPPKLIRYFYTPQTSKGQSEREKRERLIKWRLILIPQISKISTAWWRWWTFPFGLFLSIWEDGFSWDLPLLHPFSCSLISSSRCENVTGALGELFRGISCGQFILIFIYIFLREAEVIFSKAAFWIFPLAVWSRHFRWVGFRLGMGWHLG